MVVVVVGGGICTVPTGLGLARVKRENEQTQQLKATHELWFRDDHPRSVAIMLMLMLGNSWILFTFSRRKINSRRVPRKQVGAVSHRPHGTERASVWISDPSGETR